MLSLWIHIAYINICLQLCRYTHIYTQIYTQNETLSIEGVIFVLNPALNMYLLLKIAEQVNSRTRLESYNQQMLFPSQPCLTKEITTFDLRELQSTRKR